MDEVLKVEGVWSMSDHTSIKFNSAAQGFVSFLLHRNKNTCNARDYPYT
jgi:hypothetical protein